MIMTKLKEATSEQHKALESTVNIMDSAFSKEDYKDLLIRFYAFYSAIEAKLAEIDWESAGFDFKARLKSPALERDLARLGINHKANGRVLIPELDSTAQGFGALYVLEGATLGGQVIKRHLKESLGVEPDTGGEFFAGYGELTGPMWKKFAATITAFSEASYQDAEIVASAKDTFDAFRVSFGSFATAAR